MNQFIKIWLKYDTFGVDTFHREQEPITLVLSSGADGKTAWMRSESKANPVV